MKKIYVLLLVSFWLGKFGFSQADFSLEKKEAFKQKLFEMGFLQIMEVKEIYQDENFYILRLQFLSGNQDINQTAWANLQKEFAKEKSTPLIEYFYYLFINHFEIVEPQKVLIELRHSYLSEDCPFIRYYYDDKTQEFTNLEVLCKAEATETIQLKELENLSKKFILENKDKSIELIYDKILTRFKSVYTAEDGFNKKSKGVFVSKYRKGNSSLQFEIKNLQKEVLTEAGENFVYAMLTFLTGKTYLPFEHLKFTIHYTIEKQEMYIKLEGRYGSGLHGNKEWSEMTDMDTGFPVFIDNYLNEKVLPEIIRTITTDKDYGKNN